MNYLWPVRSVRAFSVREERTSGLRMRPETMNRVSCCVVVEELKHTNSHSAAFAVAFLMRAARLPLGIAGSGYRFYCQHRAQLAPCRKSTSIPDLDREEPCSMPNASLMEMDEKHS
jgi:hypothetical protein